MTIAKDPIRVSLLPNATSTKTEGRKPAHWRDAKASGFQNPWPSYQDKTAWDGIKLFSQMGGHFPSVPPDIETKIGLVRPTWGLTTSSGSNEQTNAEKIKATWLGHACFLVELPVRPSADPRPSRGARILFDPVFSERCSPFQWLGPKRYTKCPCEIEDVPEIDAIVISHNHYDHLDVDTIKAFSDRLRPPHLFVPLGNADLLRSIGITKDKIHSLDWWEGRRVEVEVDSSTGANNDGKKETGPAQVVFDVTCTPAQHQANRSIFDRYKSLWSSWAIQEVLPPSTSEPAAGGEGRKEGVKVYFAGDTGYRAVPEGADEEKVPTCPAFKEIGKRFGGFDFAMIPIGAYQPRDFMSTFHCAPQDSVRIFQDIRAKKAIGMHWGTWMLTVEEVTEPPRKLAEELRKAEIPTEDFDVCALGETLFF